MKKYALLSILFLILACSDEYGSSGAKFSQNIKISNQQVTEGRIPYFKWSGLADSVVCYQLDDSLEIKTETPCSNEWSSLTLLDSTTGFRYAKAIVWLKSSFNDSLPEVTHDFDIMVDMKNSSHPSINQFAYLIQPRIKALMLEEYSMEAAAYIASNELSDLFFLDKAGVRYDTDCDHKCGSDTAFFNLIYQGDFRKNLLKVEAFRQDFADGTVSDTSYLVDCADNMLTQKMQSYNTLKFIDRHLGLETCDSTGKKVFVTNKASTYFGDSLYCSDDNKKKFYDEYEQKLGPCIYSYTKQICDTSISRCYVCTRNGWEETSKSITINNLVKVCDSTNVDSSLTFGDSVYQCTRLSNDYFTSQSQVHYAWVSMGTDSLSFWFGNCNYNNHCKLKEHGGKKYSCTPNDWQVATESNEKCSLDYAKTIDVDLYKTIEEDSVYYACNYYTCEPEEITQEKADEYKIIEKFAAEKPCTSEIMGKSAYQPTRLQYYICERSDDGQYRWRAYGKASSFEYDTDIFI